MGVLTVFLLLTKRKFVRSVFVSFSFKLYIMGKATAVGVSDSDNLSGPEKFWAGFLLIFFTAGVLFLIVGYWPDRMPGPFDHCQEYTNSLFNIKQLSKCVVDPTDTGRHSLAAADSGKTTDSAADSAVGKRPPDGYNEEAGGGEAACCRETDYGC
jgi:hypothetical protein